jgi:Ca2+-binding EF-hand superfamily protein
MKAFLLVPLLALAMPAWAQDAPQPSNSDGSTTAPGPQSGQRPKVRFEQADTDHDGRLTRSEAAAMPFVAKHFDEIDTNHDGYISRDELRAARERMQAIRAQRAARREPSAGSSTQDSGGSPPASGGQGSN